MARPSTRSLSVGLVTLRKKGRYWYARYPSPDGGSGDHRQERALRVTNQRVALEKAREIDQLIQEGRVSSLAERRHGSTLTFAAFAEEFLKTYDRWSERTRRGDESRVRFLLREFGDYTLDAITPRMVETYLSRLREQRGITASTRNRYLSVLKAMFKTAVKWGYLANNPVALVKMTPVQSKIPDALTDSELDRLLAELPESTRRIVTIAVDTGMRLSEVQRLAWADVDVEDRYIRVRDSKNKEFRVVPMTTRLRDLLTEMRDEARQSSIRTLQVVTFSDVRTSIESAAKRAGLGHIHFHMFRHTFATRLRDRGVPLDRIKELLGHKTMVMTLRYAKVRPSQLKDAIAALDVARPSEQSWSSTG